MPRYRPEFKSATVIRLLPLSPDQVEVVAYETGVPARTLERWRAAEQISRGVAKDAAIDLPARVALMTELIERRRVPGFLVARALVMRGHMHWELEQRDRASADCTAALMKAGIDRLDRIAATLNRGMIRQQLYDYQGAAEDYSAVLAMPRVEKTARAMALVSRASIWERMGQPILGAEDLQALHALHDVSEYHWDKAELYCHRSMKLFQERLLSPAYR